MLVQNTKLQQGMRLNRKVSGRIKNWIRIVRKDFVLNKVLILMTLPVLAYYIIFHYLPMFGVVIAFKRYMPFIGIWDSPWVGLDNFKAFFTDPYFPRSVRNTLMINFYQLIFGFPAPILLALLLNEVKKSVFKRTIQSVTYLPHFISMVVQCGIIANFFALKGPINDILSLMGMERTVFLMKPEYFRSIYVGTGIWASIGWSSIIYIAALSRIDTELYEAATIDGANRWRQFLAVTLPGIMPMIVIMLILAIGRMMSEGAEKIILLYNPLTYETSDIISSYVYRRGLLQADFSYSSAVGLANSVVNFSLLVLANAVSRRVNETSLW